MAVEIGDEDFVEALMQINDNIENSTNAFEKANHMRQLGYGLFQQALREEDESAIAFVVKEHFDQYLSHVSQNHCDSVNNYTKEVANLLKNSNNPVDLSNFKPILKNSTSLNLLPCTGKFRECKLKEDDDQDSFEEAIQLKRAHESTVEYLKSDKNVLVSSDKSRIDQETDNRLSLKRIHETSQDREFELLRNIASTSSANLLPIPKSYHLKDPEKISIPNRFNDVKNNSNPMSIDVSDSLKTRAPEPFIGFRTGKEELQIQNFKKYEKTNSGGQRQPLFDYGASKKSLGARRTTKNSFVPPIIPSESSENELPKHEEPIDERLQNIDPKMVKLISNEIIHKFKPVNWNDIAGLDYAKSIIQEAVVWPLLRPDIFTGLRRPPRGILLFGPPGTGKTLIGKCIASQSKSTFFSISASSLTSKWIGEGEKMVRALFAVATVYQPAVIFIDEIDSLLCQRSESEHESSRRIKTEFLVQLDGAATSDEDRILIVGATNRPQELDEAARRRLVRRLYIPLPESEARTQILCNLLKSVKHEISEQEICKVGELTEGYSGADMESLCREAAMEPIRTIPADEIPFFNEMEVRPINFQDFQYALSRVKASNSPNDIKQYIEWNKTYGSGNV